MQAQKTSIDMANVQQNALRRASVTDLFFRKLVLGACGISLLIFSYFLFSFFLAYSLTFFGFGLGLFTFSFFPIPYRLPSVRHSIVHLGIHGQSKAVVFIPSNSKHYMYNVCLLTYRKEKKVMQEANKLSRVEGTSTYKAGIVYHNVYVRTGAFDSLTVQEDMAVNRVYLLFFILTVVNTKDSIFNFSTVRRYSHLVNNISFISLLPVVFLVFMCRLITRYFFMLASFDTPNPSPTLPEGAETAVNVPYLPVISKKK